MKWISIAFLLVVACGCKSKTVSLEFPPLPWNCIQSKTDSPLAVDISEQRQERVTIEWKNSPSLFAESFETGIEVSTNLTEWESMARVPYSTEGTITFTNRPLTEFYRLFNTIKQ